MWTLVPCQGLKGLPERMETWSLPSEDYNPVVATKHTHERVVQNREMVFDEVVESRVQKVTAEGTWVKIMLPTAQPWDSSNHRALEVISCVQLFATPWTARRQAPLSFTVSQSLLQFMPLSQ